MSYYIVKVSLCDTEQLPNGKSKDKKWVESYLVNAVSVTDAEVITAEEFKSTVIDFEIKSVVQSTIVDVLQKK